MEARLDDMRPRGRSRGKLLDWMNTDGYGILKEEARRREEWRLYDLDLPEDRELKEQKMKWFALEGCDVLY